MCISSGLAHFDRAIALACELQGGWHSFFYQNIARSLGGAVAMPLHVPAAEPLTPEDLIPTHRSPNILRDASEAVPSLWPQAKGNLTLGASRNMPANTYVVAYGEMEVVLAPDADSIFSALDCVSEPKRPRVTELLIALVQWLGRERPGFKFVLPCFNRTTDFVDHPIGVRYRPTDPTRLFAPGLESHTGEPPVIGQRERDRDITVVFGSKHMTDPGNATPVNYTEWLEPELRAALPSCVVGFRDQHGAGVNDDYSVPVEAVRKGLTGHDLFNLMPNHALGSPVSGLR